MEINAQNCSKQAVICNGTTETILEEDPLIGDILNRDLLNGAGAIFSPTVDEAIIEETHQSVRDIEDGHDLKAKIGHGHNSLEPTGRVRDAGGLNSEIAHLSHGLSGCEMVCGVGRQDHIFGPIKDGVQQVNGMSCLQEDYVGVGVNLGLIKDGVQRVNGLSCLQEDYECVGMNHEPIMSGVKHEDVNHGSIMRGRESWADDGLSCHEGLDMQVDHEGLDGQLGPIGVTNWCTYLDRPTHDVERFTGIAEMNTQSELLVGGKAIPITVYGSGKSGSVQNEERLCDVPILDAVDSDLLFAKFQEERPKKRRGRPKKVTKSSMKVSSSNVDTVQTILSLDLELGEIAENVWDIGKVLGVSHPSSGSDILQSLLELEKRDRVAISISVGRD
ncbi:type I methionyl aminopeptidase [Sesbania bispinosa]|nr:type I methionyl aminopeptidase [Sesbania bispinosa]